MTITTETLLYEADGLAMVGTLYIDDASADKRPGVLLFPEALGPGPNVHSRARRLAEAGYAALVCDLHGGALAVESVAEIMDILKDLLANPQRTRARARGALDVLGAHARVIPDRVAAIGFCFGGTMSLELGRSGAPLAAIVGFHSGLVTTVPADAANIRCKVLVCIGAEDPGVPAAQRQAFEEEMRAGKVDWTMHLYGGVLHSFTNPEAAKLNMPDFARYDAGADKHSWEAMMSLFAETLYVPA